MLTRTHAGGPNVTEVYYNVCALFDDRETATGAVERLQSALDKHNHELIDALNALTDKPILKGSDYHVELLDAVANRVDLRAMSGSA